MIAGTTSDGLADPKIFQQFMHDGEGLKAILAGKASGSKGPKIIWPHVSTQSKIWFKAKLGFEDRISEWRSLGGWNAYKAEPGLVVPRGSVTPGIHGPIVRPDASLSRADWLKTGFAHAVTGLTQQLPTRNAVAIMGAEAGHELSQFLRFGMAYDEGYKVMGEFYAATNSAGEPG